MIPVSASGPRLASNDLGLVDFVAYVRAIRTALADYTCTIDDLIVSDLRAAARLTFEGRHVARIFETEATGRIIRWTGAAFFTTNGEQITEFWVEGDIDAVKQQLGTQSGAPQPFS